MAVNNEVPGSIGLAFFSWTLPPWGSSRSDQTCERPGAGGPKDCDLKVGDLVVPMIRHSPILCHDPTAPSASETYAATADIRAWHKGAARLRSRALPPSARSSPEDRSASGRARRTAHAGQRAGAGLGPHRLIGALASGSRKPLWSPAQGPCAGPLDCWRR